MLVDVPDRDHQVLAGLGVDGKQLGVIGDDRRTGCGTARPSGEVLSSSMTASGSPVVSLK